MINRKKTGPGTIESLISTGKEMFHNRMSAVSNKNILTKIRFKGQLGSAITVITSLIVGFLIIPNNILYFIDNEHHARTHGDTLHGEQATHRTREHENAYIHAGIALVTLGCLAMVVSIVLSYFAAKSEWKMRKSDDYYWDPESVKTSRTVTACLVMMNFELFMAVIAGCMELLYRPLISNARRMRNMEFAIAVFNIIIYAMYVPTMVLTSNILKAKQEKVQVDVHRDVGEAISMPAVRDYMTERSANPYNSHSSFI